jgi:cell division transport system ATP-binding protein
MSDQAIVELSNVYLKSDRGEEVFSNLNFKLPIGRSAVITGGAGSGKSFLIELLVGRRAADSGSVEVFGEFVDPRRKRKLNRMRRKIGGMGGLYGLIPSFTVAQNIAFPLVINGLRKKVQRDRLMKALTEFSLLKQTRVFPDSLTRVEHTLTQFARATIANQPLLLVDEPLAGLDTATYQSLYEHLVKISVSGRSMVMVTSDLPGKRLPNSDYYEIKGGALV